MRAFSFVPAVLFSSVDVPGSFRVPVVLRLLVRYGLAAFSFAHDFRYAHLFLRILSICLLYPFPVSFFLLVCPFVSFCSAPFPKSFLMSGLSVFWLLCCLLYAIFFYCDCSILSFFSLYLALIFLFLVLFFLEFPFFFVLCMISYPLWYDFCPLNLSLSGSFSILIALMFSSFGFSCSLSVP